VEEEEECEFPSIGELVCEERRGNEEGEEEELNALKSWQSRIPGIYRGSIRRVLSSKVHTQREIP
jgi:hypothetical protein